MINEDKLFSKLENIKTKDDFISFFVDFRLYVEENHETIENNTLPSYLEALGAVVKDSDGYYKNMKIDESKLSKWRIFADILMAATVYE